MIINDKLYHSNRPILRFMDNFYYEETQFKIDTNATFIIKDKNQNKINETTASIYSINQTKVKINFANNDFLINLFYLIDNKDLFLLCKLLFEEKEFLFCATPTVINLVDINRKEILVDATLKLSNKPTTRNNIVNLLTLIFMKDIK